MPHLLLPLLCAPLLAGAAPRVAPPEPWVSPDLAPFIESKMAAAHVPGLAVAIIADGRIAYSAGFGQARVDEERPVRSETGFMLASVSKTLCATAVMQVVETGLLGLDDDVNAHLDFAVINPAAPETAITPRMLLAHVSSIEDNWNVLSSLYVDGDSPIPLGEFCREYLVPGGAYYTDGSYSSQPPLSRYSYSNVGVALAGYLVEAVTGIDFDAYCEEAIFAPLGMDPCAWHLAGLDPADLAAPHRFNHFTRKYRPLAHYGYPDYPDGQLRTSSRGLARFLAAIMGDGSFAGATILQPESVAEIYTVQYPWLDPDQGLVFYRDGDRVGHNGGDTGVATLMFHQPAADTGALLLANGGADWPGEWAALEAILDRLFEEAERL